MLKIQNKEVSLDLEQERHERDALLSQKNNLQAEMVSLGETNKRVKKEIENSEKTIEDLTIRIEGLVESLDKINGLKYEKEQEIKDLDGKYAYRKSVLEASLPDVEKILSDLKISKSPIESEINSLISTKLESLKKLEEVNKDIEDKKKNLAETDSNIGLRAGQLGLLNSSIVRKELEFKKLEEQVIKNEAIVFGIEKRQIVLADINKDIADAELKLILIKKEQKDCLETENSTLKEEIRNNKEINEQEKSLHISLLNKKQTLDNKESFLKNQYTRAGLKWD